MTFEPRTMKAAISEALDEMVGIDFSYDQDRQELADALHLAMQRWTLEYVAVLLNGLVTHAHDGHAIIYTDFTDPTKISKEYWDEYQNEEGEFHEDVDETEDVEDVEEDEIEEETDDPADSDTVATSG